jgi:GNAT superfamily N-acetyltransferase
MGLEILLADPCDIGELTRVEIESKVESIPQLIEPVEVNPARRRERWRTYFLAQSPATSRAERVVLKALVDGELVGYLAGHLTTRFGKDAEIENFYVLRSRQRQGIGSALLRRFTAWLAEQGARSLCVGIFRDNPYQAFYLKYGGAHLNAHWVVWADVAAMRSRLAADSSRDGQGRSGQA